ncbi:T9SS type A sorting domain-containing protein [bacterium]|nr:T9SS type A sorting domain-containing protein [bacterium]MBU1983533.1 T9SS type A sorting domain-containing protein [bacterium]
MIRALLLMLLMGWVVVSPAVAALDMGDLPACGYPTLFANPGHTISGIAWLGDCITAETSPQTLDGDACDDGVTFLNSPWYPCTPVQVQVVVTPGPIYPNWTGTLYLNGWKDGNRDGDFCDTLCGGADDPNGAPEWIIQDALVTPGIHVFTFPDPGVLDQGVYEGIFRFRLSQLPLGPYGFGLFQPGFCPDMCFGTFAFDTCGEVEDYIIEDLQLAVEINDLIAIAGDGEVTLNWRTASELQNDRFEIERDGNVAALVPSRGNTPSGFDYAFTDRGLENDRRYEYALYSVDLTGTRELLRTASVVPMGSHAAPTEYSLHQNYPNPFNPSTQIVFDLKEQVWVKLRVYDLQGRQVAELQDGVLPQGRHTANFNGSTLPTGLYICRMQAGDFASEIKMLLIK